MTKLLSKIIGGILGVTLATSAGVGIAFSMDNEYKEAKAATTATLTFTAACDGLGTDDKANDWVVTSDAAESTFDSTKGIHYGTSKLAVSYLEVTSDVGFTTVTSVTINASGASNTSAKANVTVGGAAFGSQASLTSSAANYSFSGSASGVLKVRLSQTSATKALYIKSISVTYVSTQENVVTDTLTRSTTGVSGTTYTNWSNKRLTSSAVYAGNSAGGNSSIQLRSSDNAGVITTASGGRIKSVIIDFESHTNSARVVDIYAKTEVYTSSADLYSADTRGTKVGSVAIADGAIQEITIAGNYTFVGVRSNSGALYLNSIKFNWSLASQSDTITDIEVTTEPTKVSYGVGEAFSIAGMVVKGTYTNAGVIETNNYTVSPADGYVFQTSDISNSKTVTVTSVEDNTLSDTFTIQVIAAFPTSLTATYYPRYVSGMKLNEGVCEFKATYTDASEVQVFVDNSKLVIKDTNNNVVSKTADADDYSGQTLKFEYTDQGHTVYRNARIDIVESLYVENVRNVPEYILINSTSDQISAKYQSFEGKPTVTVTSNNPSKLSVTFNNNNVSYYEDSKTGYIPFTVTASGSEGQYSVIITLSLGEQTASKSASIIVRSAAPGHDTSDGEYVKVTSLSDVTTGKYAIAANVDGSYKGANSFGGKQLESTTLTVSNNKITSNDFLVFDITKTNNTYTIQDSAKDYLHANKNNAELSFSSTSFTWTIESGTNGSFSIIPTSSDMNTKGLIFRTSTYNYFRAYALSNLSSHADEYYDIELFKYNGSESSFDLVKDFVDNYMHMDDISISNTNDTGACLGNSGYYLTAKAAWNAMATGYTGSDDLVDVFETKFADAYARYMAWASRNGDTQPFTGTSIVSLNRNSVVNTNTESTMTVIVVLVALCMASLLGAYILKKKRAK